MITWRKVHFLLVAIALYGTTGCISWYSGTAMKAGDGPAMSGRGADNAGSERATVGFAVTFNAVGVETTSEKRQIVADKLSEMAQEAFRQADRYGVSKDAGDSDYVIAIDVRDDGEPNIPLAVLSGITLTILPAVATDNFTIDAELRARGGAPLGSHRVTEKMTTLIEFFMLFGMPVASPRLVEKEMWHDVMTDLAVWSDRTIREKGGARKPVTKAVTAPPPDHPE